MRFPASPAWSVLRVVGRHLLPLLAFLASLLLLWTAQVLRLEEGRDLFPWPLLALCAILAIDAGMGFGYDRGFARGRRWLHARGRDRWARLLWLVPAAVRAAAWILAFWMLVEDPARVGDPNDFRSWQGQARLAWYWVLLVAWMRPALTALAGVAWLALYEAVVVRWRGFRGVVFLGVGPLLVWVLIGAWYHQWGVRQDPRDVASQPGVRLLFDAQALPEEGQRRPWLYSRDLLVDEEAGQAFISFGATLGRTREDDRNLWRIDLATSDFRSLPSSQVRVMAMDPDGPYLYAFPWFRHEILKIDRRTFEVARRIDFSAKFPFYTTQPTDVVVRPPFAYVSMCYLPLVLRLDLREDRVTDVLDLREDGLLETGSLCCHFADAPDRGTVFFTASRQSRNVIGTIDLDRFRVASSATLPVNARWVVRAGLPDRRTVFAIDDYDGRVFELDEDRLAPRWVCDLSPRSMLAEDPVSHRLLQIDPFHGTLTFRDFDCNELRTVFVGGKPGGIHAGQAGIYVTSAAGLVLVERPAAVP